MVLRRAVVLMLGELEIRAPAIRSHRRARRNDGLDRRMQRSPPPRGHADEPQPPQPVVALLDQAHHPLLVLLSPAFGLPTPADGFLVHLDRAQQLPGLGCAQHGRDLVVHEPGRALAEAHLTRKFRRADALLRGQVT